MRLFLFFSLCFSLLSAYEQPTLFPPALQKGDLIAVVCPASFLGGKKEKARQILAKKIKWLEKQGYKTICYPINIEPNGYLAGTDSQRAQALMNAWRNPKVKAIWCFRGGYGTCRILDLLDYDWIQKHPKILLGMSDITALHSAIQKKTGLVTFLAPNLNYFDQQDSDFDDSYSIREMEKIAAKGIKEHIEIPEPGDQIEVIRPGKATGKIVGGNLCLVSSLCGTKWQIDTKGKILILEDVGETIFRIDRMLWQLKESGLLDEPAAVVLGTWIACKKSLPDSLTLKEVFHEYFGEAKYPVILGFPTGHSKLQTTIPLNVMATIDTSHRHSMRLLESAVRKKQKEKAPLSK